MRRRCHAVLYHGGNAHRGDGFDLGLFFNDDWRLKPNLTLSYGLRLETQNNISNRFNFAPRIGLAWGIGAKGTSGAKTVLRAGEGISTTAY